MIITVLINKRKREMQDGGRGRKKIASASLFRNSRPEALVNICGARTGDGATNNGREHSGEHVRSRSESADLFTEPSNTLAVIRLNGHSVCVRVIKKRPSDWGPNVKDISSPIDLCRRMKSFILANPPKYACLFHYCLFRHAYSLRKVSGARN